MEIVIASLAMLTMLHLLYTAIEFWFGFKSIKNLVDEPTLNHQDLPKLSIIFSALNEKQSIARSLESILHLDYPNLEIIAINDRSTDGTDIILENYAKIYENLHIIHVKYLPENWLGKNHALQLGSQKAMGDWLLFTDADVIMKNPLLVKAMSFAIHNELDHLTIYEQHLHKPFLLKILSLGSYITYAMAMKPWRIRYPWSNKHLGHGAFNLVKKSVYQESGGHRAIALECLDDVRLGKLLKSHGFRQDTVDAKDLIGREWYSSLKEMIHGLSKNGFAFFDYKLWKITRDVTLALLYYIWPIVAIFFFRGCIFWMNMCNIMIMFYLNMFIANKFRLPKILALFYPLSIAILIYTLCYSVYLTYKNNGIIWRDTHYLLQTLRSKVIPRT